MRKEIVVVAVAVTAMIAAAAVVKSSRSAKRWRKIEEIVKQIRDGASAPMALLWRVADDLADEMIFGLKRDGGSSLRVIASPTIALPTGEEEGLFYGVEIGRTKIRMSRMQLGGKGVGITRKTLAEIPLPVELMVGTSEELYQYIIAQLVTFILGDKEGLNVQEQRLNVGFTFPFPVLYSETSGTLVEWSKGFSIKEAAGKDAVAGINEAMKKHRLDLHASLVANDCVGALAGGRYIHNETVVAVIMGTGTNATYTEATGAVAKWQGPAPKMDETIINMEWDNFNSSHFPITEVDLRLDAESQNPGEQIYGKLISGLYLGEIVRGALLKIAEETDLFGCEIPAKLKIPFSLRTPDVASMHQDISGDLEVIGDILEKSLGISNTSLKTREIVLEICDIFAKRSARLAGAGIVGILKKLGSDGTDKKAVVVVKGGLYEHYRVYRHYLHSAVKEMLHGKLSDNVVFDDLDEAYGIGAALLAASNMEQVESF